MTARPDVNLICKECGSDFIRRDYRPRRNLEQFCSLDCYTKSRVIYKTKEARKENAILRYKKHVKNNPEKYKARYTLYNEIAHGRMVKPAHCSCCETLKIQAHHPDYSKPLDVIWLCFKCHRALHKKQLGI